MLTNARNTLTRGADSPARAVGALGCVHARGRRGERGVDAVVVVVGGRERVVGGEEALLAGDLLEVDVVVPLVAEADRGERLGRVGAVDVVLERHRRVRHADVHVVRARVGGRAVGVGAVRHRPAQGVEILREEEEEEEEEEEPISTNTRSGVARSRLVLRANTRN